MPATSAGMTVERLIDFFAETRLCFLGSYMPQNVHYDERKKLDVTVSNVVLFQLEYMADNPIWMRLHRDEAFDIVIWLTSTGKITASVERI